MIAVAALGLISSLLYGDSLRESAAVSLVSLTWVLACTILIAPLSLLALTSWTALVYHWPALEESAVTMAVGLAFLVLVLALATGMISNWEALRFANDRTAFVRETAGVALSVIAWSAIGIITPRFVSPPLRAAALRRLFGQ